MRRSRMPLCGNKTYHAYRAYLIHHVFCIIPNVIQKLVLAALGILVLCKLNFCHFGCVKAAEIADRKLIRCMNTDQLAKPAVDDLSELSR
jgi:hypothetical protein